MSDHAEALPSVAVAVSGGGDSLLALTLVREQGQRTIALHAHFLPPTPARLREAEALGRLCANLGAQYVDIDLSREFDERVIAPFAADYCAGLTPNPCGRCNALMKFGVLLDVAGRYGATQLTTGHYVRLVEHGRWGQMPARGVDPVKDQSYFLALVSRERLLRGLFPLGDRHKADVRAELAQRAITAAPLPESQEVCFIEHDDYRAFLLHRAEAGGPRPGPPGPILSSAGETLGRHGGLWSYTPGQRRGLGIAWSEPLYVIAKDFARNALIVGPRQELTSAGCLAGDLNAFAPPEQWPRRCLVQTRYRQTATPAEVVCTGDTLAIRFDSPRTPPAPGQIAAVYSTEGVLLGGGVILEATSS